jgi:AraC family transcriptional regulator of adaptative response / DNA-3-methyladenine glycosylase II
MQITPENCLKALATHDPRFDGLFFIGVTSTGIYCRPVCTARPPARKNLRFYERATQAEKAGFRPCLRCRPELAPGHAPCDAVKNLALRAAARIDAGALTEGRSLESFAQEFGVTSRHLRRTMQKELGVSPIELAQTRRLLLAKQLLAETRMPITQIAHSSGFESVRRFNGLFRTHYRLTPSTMRRASAAMEDLDGLRLSLAYRPPFDWARLLRFFAHRAAEGAEFVVNETYARTLSIGKYRGWLSAAPIAGKNALRVTISDSLSPALPRILGQLRRMFDLDARPDLIAEQLAADPKIARLVKRFPGARLPGAMNGFEVAARAIIGQRISVAAATTIAGRFTCKFGQSIKTPFERLTCIAPTADRIAEARPNEIASLGLTQVRAHSLIALAKFWSDRDFDITGAANPEAAMEELQSLRGIGPWTANYIAMRALQWPDAFPAGDLVLCKAAGDVTAKQLEQMSQPWRPWRAYAAILLWNAATGQ